MSTHRSNPEGAEDSGDAHTLHPALLVFAAVAIGICTGGFLALFARAGLYISEGQRHLLVPLALTAMGAHLASSGGTFVGFLRAPEQKPECHPHRWVALAIMGAVLVLLLAFTLPAVAHLRSGKGNLDALFLSVSGAAGLLLPVWIFLSLGATSTRAYFPVGLVLSLVGLAGGALLARTLSSSGVDLRNASALFTLIGMTAPLLVVSLGGSGRWQRPAAIGLVILVAGQAATQSFKLLDRFYERTAVSEKLAPPLRYARIVENAHGVLTLHPSGVLRQNGIYQGTTNISPHPKLDINRSRRAYLVPSVLKNTGSVLLIGLGSGDWLQILAHHKDIKSITVLEDNPAFEFMVKNSGHVASALRNAKVKVVNADVPTQLDRMGTFDAILQDQFAFRGPSPSPYLTKEHIARLKKHLSPDGGVFVNTQGEPQAEKAILDNFSHALRYQDMMFGSERPIGIRGYHWMDVLETFTIDGRPVLPKKEADKLSYEIVMNRDWKTGFAWEKDAPLRARLKDTAPWTEQSLDRSWLHWR